MTSLPELVMMDSTLHAWRSSLSRHRTGKGSLVLRGLSSCYATDAPKCSINECFGQHCVLRSVWRRGSTKAGEAGRRD